MLDYEVVGKVILRPARQLFKLQRCIRATVTSNGKLEIECNQESPRNLVIPIFRAAKERNLRFGPVLKPE